MFGFMDESGAPGVAKTANDYLAVSLVIFENREAAERCSAAIDRLRTRLKRPSHYEFHFTANANSSRGAFIKLIPNLDFRIITIAIKKNLTKSTASYRRLGELLARELPQGYPSLHIEMDANPILQKELKKHIKSSKTRVTVKSVRSNGNNLVQLADYIVALSVRRLKGSPEAVEQYRPLVKKQLYFTEVGE